VITVTAVDSSGNATAATITTPGNGNPYDGTDDTLVGIQNNSGSNLNSITLVSSNTTYGGLFGFDDDGPCAYNSGYCFNFPAGYTPTGYEGPDNTFSGFSAKVQDGVTYGVPPATSGTVNFITPIASGGCTWFALEGVPQSLSVVTQQGTPITLTSGLTQSFVFGSTPGGQLELDFDDSVSNDNGDLTIQPGTIPFVSDEGISAVDWASIVNGTAMADAPCLLAAGQTDTLGRPQCAVYTVTCTTTADPTPSGANCPKSTVRNILFNQVTDLVQTQSGIANGILTIPAGYAPGLAMASDALTPGAQCSYPSSSPLAGQICPRSIMTQIADATPKPGGTTTSPNSTYVFFCCEPEWQTTPLIPLWNKTTSVPALFTSVPPATPSPNPNNFQAAQGAFVVVGAEPRGVALHTTYPLPGEESLNTYLNTPIPPCPTPGVSPLAYWSTQNPQTFSVNGLITTFDNGTTTPTPITEGAYDAHYYSVDCDDFEELVYPGSLNVTPGPATGNQATFKTVPFNIDLTPPIVTSITLNQSGGYYPQNSSLTASVTCTDPSSPTVQNFFSGIAKCGSQTSPQLFSGNQHTVTTTPIPLSTLTLGPQTFTASAVDQAGNPSPPASVSYQVVGAADVAIEMVALPVVKTGTNLTYLIGVVNKGPNTADLVTVDDALPANTSFVSAGYAIESCTMGTNGRPICSISSPTLSCGSVSGSCSIGALAAWASKNPIGAVVQITVKVDANAKTIITDTAVVSSANADPNLTNNTATWSTIVTK
jgi:uncharacterized repeat protein (TIGR01451 family)